MTDDRYEPIESYGLVGNCQTCALVGPEGSVDWFPFPHVESPSLFAAILDPDEGGRFRVGPAERAEVSRQYVERTNVLETTFETATGTARLTDFLPPTDVDHPSKVLYRRVTCSDGTVTFDVDFHPRFDYGRAETTVTRTDDGILASGKDERTLLESQVDLAVESDRVTGTGTLEAGETQWLLLRCTGAEDAAIDPDAALADTVAYWADWAHDCPDDCPVAGPWHDLAVRSGLVLKLLTHADSGGIVAAPTTSLPEDIGGVRNWDYRYNWLRDAGFTVQALSGLGHVDTAVDYVEWVMDLCQVSDPETIQPLYGLHGTTDLTEEELDHLAGYRNSRPVRIGNGAVDQRQLDIYGELLLAVDEMLEHDRELGTEEWERIRGIVDYVRDVWEELDAGIWEVRTDPQQFVFSKVMCWVALDRGIDIARSSGLDAPLDEWRETRQQIRERILAEGYDESEESFVQTFDSTAVDATALLFPIVGFLPFDNHRIQSTLETIEDRLVEDDVLVRRYDGPDGLPGEEGAFVLCSCWLIDVLALSGRVDEARERFEALCEYVSPLGLMAEELDRDTGSHLGNYPQAFSHIGIVNNALYLGYAGGHEIKAPAPMGIRLGEPVAPGDR